MRGHSNIAADVRRGRYLLLRTCDKKALDDDQRVLCTADKWCAELNLNWWSMSTAHLRRLCVNKLRVGRCDSAKVRSRGLHVDRSKWPAITVVTYLRPVYCIVFGRRRNSYTVQSLFQGCNVITSEERLSRASGASRWLCDVCGSVFRGRWHLKRHIKTPLHRARERGFPIPTMSRCGMATREANERRRHQCQIEQNSAEQSDQHAPVIINVARILR